MPESEMDLRKLFQSSEELNDPETATLQGQLPQWLRCGKFIRIGPGLFDLGNFTVNHWLDGYAILSKFEIQGETVTFHKKFLQSDAYKRARAAQRPVITEFGTKAYPDPNKGLLSRLVSSIMPEMTDNDSSNIFKLGKDYFVCNDSCFFRKFDTESLRTEDKFDSNRLFGLNGLSAHPLTDENGDMYNIGFSALTGLKFSIIRIPSSDGTKTSKEMLKEAKVVCNIPSSYGPGCISYVHSFGMNSKYIIFIEQPYVASISAIASALIKGHSVKDWLEWRPNLKNRFHLIDKETGKLVKIEMISDEKPFFFLHIVNCYMEDEQMVVDVMALDDPGILDGMYMCKLRSNIVENNAQPSGRRFVIPVLGNIKEVPSNTNLVKVKGTSATAMKTGSNTITLTSDQFTEEGCDMPVMNSKFIGKKHTYIYCTGTIAENSFRNAVYKINVNDRSGGTFWRDNSSFTFPGEPVFVADPLGKSEDSGILIVALSTVKAGESDFIVFIDASSMLEIARVSFKAHIPGALHGIFVES